MDRRSFLRGLGQVAIALPTLELMLDAHGEALASGTPIPRRFLLAFSGQSIGADDDDVPNLYAPNTIGADYDLKTALAPLAPVKGEVSVVSGLKIPWAGENGGAIPAGGRDDSHHIQYMPPLLTGMRTRGQDDPRLSGPTADQVVADAIGAGVRFKTLNYQVQAAWYFSTGAPDWHDIVSAKRDGAGKIVKVPATVSPRAAYDGMFTGFTAADPKVAQAEALELEKRKSVLDLVRRNTEKLLPKLGVGDRARLERHFDEIRDLERRIAAIAPPTTGTCKKLPDPGADSPVGGANSSMGGAGYDVNRGYSEEDARARVFCDLIAMAFACDLARSGTLMFTMAQSHLNMHPLIGVKYDLHEIGHALGTEEVSKALAWQVKHFAYLVGKLRDTPEGSGRLLDHCALVFHNEAGHGYDPETRTNRSSHSTENMACLIAGGRAGGLKPGQHVKATGKHPVHVTNSAMKACGVAQDLGEVKGVVPELFA